MQIRGKVRVHSEEAFLRRAITLLGEKYDPGFDIKKNVEENTKLLASIVGIEIDVDEVFGKFKLAQSKPADERQNVINVLRKSGSTLDQNVAKAMEETLN